MRTRHRSTSTPTPWKGGPGAAALLLALIAASCGDSGASVTDGPNVLPLDTGGDVPADIPPSDLGGLLDVPPDVDPTDPVDVDDVPDGSADAGPSAGEVGAPCTQNADCASSLCAQLAPGVDEGVCTRPCTTSETCPEDFTCIPVEVSGQEARLVCIPTGLCIDPDEDGFGAGLGCAGQDCAPQDGNIFPGAEEICDGIDNNCDGRVDNNVSDANQPCNTGFPGVCGLGFSRCVDGALQCEPSTTAAEEFCDGLDNDCDGTVDEAPGGGTFAVPCFAEDAALVGVGVCRQGSRVCEGRGGLGICLGQVLPSAELCDGLDNDCDGTIDEGISTQSFWPDRDGDGFGDASADPISACVAPVGWVATRTDCDDTDDAVFPGATERAGDGVDQNCDGQELCFVDADDDDWRANTAATVTSSDITCTAPGLATATTPVGDCNDSDRTIHPDATELPADGVDQDCDGLELCYVDGDADGSLPEPPAPVLDADRFCTREGLGGPRTPGGDCDDTRADVGPVQPEVCDGADNNCNGRVDEGAGCYPLDDPCEIDLDCASGYCEAGVCADPFGCAVPGSCPTRGTTTHGGGEGASERYRLDVTVGGAVQAPASFRSARYRLTVGVQPWRNGPLPDR